LYVLYPFCFFYFASFLFSTGGIDPVERRGRR